MYNFKIDAVLIKLNRTISTNVTVQIMDENDNYPIFIKGFEYMKIIWQPNQLVYRIGAVDDDDGRNGTVQVQIKSHQEYFRITNLYMFTTDTRPTPGTYR